MRWRRSATCSRRLKLRKRSRPVWSPTGTPVAPTTTPRVGRTSRPPWEDAPPTGPTPPKAGGPMAGSLRSRLGRPMRVRGQSMAPHLRDGDLVLVRDLTANALPLQLGDVVAFRSSCVMGRTLVKRVAALDRDQLVVVGDNPLESFDSRMFGPIRRAELVGRVWARLWPPRRLGA